MPSDAKPGVLKRVTSKITQAAKNAVASVAGAILAAIGVSED